MVSKPVRNLSVTITTEEDIRHWMIKHLNMLIYQPLNPYSMNTQAKLFPKFLVELVVRAPRNFRITLLDDLCIKKNIINLKNVVQLT